MWAALLGVEICKSWYSCCFPNWVVLWKFCQDAYSSSTLKHLLLPEFQKKTRRTCFIHIGGPERLSNI
jgi:hypothetical protein